MGRLIDADLLLNDIEKSRMDNPHKDVQISANHNHEHQHFMIMTVKQPIAYDVDDVVKQIKEYLNGYRICSDYDEEFFLALEEYIINIVIRSDETE
jgi:hypothetical protein